MKKISLILLIIIFLSGCSVNYDLEITENDLTEETTIMTDVNKNESYEGEALTDILDKTKNDYFEPIFSNPSNYDEYIGGFQPNVDYYKVDDYQNNNWQGLKLSNTFERSSFYRSRMVKYCFKEVDYQNDGTYIMLRTNNSCDVFKSYSLLEEITVNIKTDLNVVVTNADRVNDNVYTWVINRNNYQNKPIRMTYKLNKDDIKEEQEEKPKEENKEEQNNENKSKQNYNKVILVISFIILLGVLSIVIIKKNKRL